MIPLIPTLSLAFISFICSAFVILRIMIPILPPHPLSRRVSPAEFGLPNFRSLSPAQKSHLWLHCLDLVTIALFVWQAIAESTGSVSGYEGSKDAAYAVRLWLVMTLRQTCLLMVASITLLHVRMGRSVSFGTKHWVLWAPTFVLAVTSTGVAGVLAGARTTTLFLGLITYSTTIAAFTSIAFVCLVGTLVVIKRNLAVANEDAEPWPPAKNVDEKPRPSFASEDVEEMRDGASWITSNASSHRKSLSNWSFSTHHTTVPSHHGHGRPQGPSHPSVPGKSSYWFGGSTTSIPPVPTLPAPYGPLSPTAESMRDEDPFRRCATPVVDDDDELGVPQRPRMGSQTSWLTSINGSEVALSAWSYPTTQARDGSMRNASSPNINTELLPSTAVSRPNTPAMASAQVLGGYGQNDSERGLSALAAPGTSVDISVYRALGWLFAIWIPLGFAYPYLCSSLQNQNTTPASDILLILSVTLASPILMINWLTSPLPIPSGLFDVRGQLPPSDQVARGSSPFTSTTYKASHEYKRSTSASVTVIEGRRSGDVWMSNGNASDGKGKFGRAMSLVAPMPKLSVLPPDDDMEGETTPPIPIQDEDSLPVSIHNTPHSQMSAQFGRIRQDSKASSHYSGADDSLAYASRIMVAQRHYSALAQTFKVSASTEDLVGGPSLILNAATASGVKTRPTSGHLRTRSVSSIVNYEERNISPPPSMPLPPTPPNVRAARLAKHKKSYSSGFSFGAVDDMNEIDALTAGVLPLLVPGLTVGSEMKIKTGHWTPPGTFSKRKDRKLARMLQEFGGEFSSPKFHSTPAASATARPRVPRARKTSAHKKNHWSLPSLSLGKDGVHSVTNWTAEVKGALEHHTGHVDASRSVDMRRNTVIGMEARPSLLHSLDEEDSSKSNLARAVSTRSLGLRAEVPHGVDTARSSMASINMVPPSAASTVTLFELDGPPVATSTPHQHIARGSKQSLDQEVPPVPSRRSSIMYIRSDSTPTAVTPPQATTMSSLAQWSSRAVRPLMPKASNILRKASGGKRSPPGLRPLSLLQDRDANAPASPQLQGTSPLNVGKRVKVRAGRGENANPDQVQSKGRSLKPLQLSRSETSKMRGILRQGEVLPDVVVRPPSNAYAYE